jgi:hypothetical protein
MAKENGVEVYATIFRSFMPSMVKTVPFLFLPVKNAGDPHLTVLRKRYTLY